MNAGYSEGEKSVTYPMAFNTLQGFTTGLVDSSQTFAEHISVNATNTNARVFLHALNAINVEISAWIFLAGI